jgi:uncharacterized protein YndB with AHSA1/START domain
MAGNNDKEPKNKLQSANNTAIGMMRTIEKSVLVNANINDVWTAWTTVDGCTSFFAPACKIDLAIGGAYEMYFMLDADEGLRGGEDCTILAMQQEKMLSFTWNAPPDLSEIRAQFTHVSVYFESLSVNKTRVSLFHDGWGVGEMWDRAVSYFDKAWGDVVLPRLQQRFESGPIDWKKVMAPKTDD